MQCPYTRCHFNRAEKQLNVTDPPTGSSRHTAVFVHAIYVAHWWNRISHVHKRLQIGRSPRLKVEEAMDPSIFAHFKHVLQNDLTGHLPKSSLTGLNKMAQLLQPFDRQLRHTGEPCLTRIWWSKDYIGKHPKNTIGFVLKSQMSTFLSNSEVSDVQVSFPWLSDCFVCPFLRVHTDPTSHSQLFGRMICQFHWIQGEWSTTTPFPQSHTWTWIDPGTLLEPALLFQKETWKPPCFWPVM